MFVSKLTRIAKKSSSFNLPKRSFSSLGKNEKEREILDKYRIRIKESKLDLSCIETDIYYFLQYKAIDERSILYKILENQVEIKNDLELLKNSIRANPFRS